MNKAAIEAFFQRLSDANPEPRGELNYTNPYTLLVAVALSAQATDIGVNKATEKLFQIVATPQDMINLGEEALIDHVRTIGLFRGKAKNIMAAARILVEKHDGVVPNDQAALEELPGVGRKTANVVRNIAFGEPTMAVDTHIFRLGNRTGMATGKTTLAVEKGLLKKIPPRFMNHAHHWLILHGRYICKARKPRCGDCIVSDLCNFKDKTPATL
ncbi:MAG: endonuclease III [Pseudomonadota bacterium]